ncbi:MAG: cyclic pyranopterin monophosphate synthase MoaC [Acidimicrobiaceae bacterium]|jgi:cyclic pyranopterin phosphate synthase|nr:cyclic pyranopterin monophosphate synthase MoaC [Acidimicrobiaceae bacterium]|tara:strand:+ start:42020 stop:42493 length:474 start_codon:yes stop_codon:yes gene_type:complete
MTEKFSHLDEAGQARMVDVASKGETARRAVAKAKVIMGHNTINKLSHGEIPKGDVFAAARIAGIQAAKKTSELIPLCHPLSITSVSVDLEECGDHVAIEAVVSTVGKTGVEMEALTACSVAALTIYDMCKSVDKAIVISDIALWKKTGGKTGTYTRE